MILNFSPLTEEEHLPAQKFVPLLLQKRKRFGLMAFIQIFPQTFPFFPGNETRLRTPHQGFAVELQGLNDISTFLWEVELTAYLFRLFHAQFCH